MRVRSLWCLAVVLLLAMPAVGATAPSRGSASGSPGGATSHPAGGARPSPSKRSAAPSATARRRRLRGRPRTRQPVTLPLSGSTARCSSWPARFRSCGSAATTRPISITRSPICRRRWLRTPGGRPSRTGPSVSPARAGAAAWGCGAAVEAGEAYSAGVVRPAAGDPSAVGDRAAGPVLRERFAPGAPDVVAADPRGADRINRVERSRELVGRARPAQLPATPHSLREAVPQHDNGSDGYPRWRFGLVTAAGNTYRHFAIMSIRCCPCSASCTPPMPSHTPPGRRFSMRVSTSSGAAQICMPLPAAWIFR